MKILELELDLYKRLALNHIRHFKIELKELVQLILGTNASGKSSILYELSPLPANHKSYHKGGKKRILISHLNKTYELISDFADGQDHYFIVDGENLNVGRTVTVQKELVKEHFGLTVEIHEVLLGYEQFTLMSPSRRRELLTTFCSVDYTYAIKLYKRIQESLRDTSGAIKLAKKRLATESANSLKEEEIAPLRVRLSELNKESQAMYMLRNASAPTVWDARTVAEAATRTIEDLLTKFRTVRKMLRDKCYFTPEEYQEDVDSKRSELASVEGVYARLSEEYLKASSEVEAVSGLETEDTDRLKDEIIANNNAVKTLLAKRKSPLEGINPLKSSQTMELVREGLSACLMELSPDPDGNMTSAKLHEVNDRLLTLEQSLSVNKEKLANVEHQEKHLRDLSLTEKINCPECKHEWRLGYSEQTHLGLQNRILQGREIVNKLSGEITKLKEQQVTLQHYSQHFREYTRITRGAVELQPLWDLINEQDAIRQSPNNVLSMIDLVRNDLYIEMQAESIKEKIATDVHRLKLAEYAQSEVVKGKKIRLEALEHEIGILSKRKVFLNAELQELLSIQKQIKHMYDLGYRLRTAQQAYDETTYAIIEAVKNEVIDEALSETHREIATLSTRIHSIDQHESLIADLKLTIEGHEKSEKAYKALADVLSPTDGLIAEGMLGFIRVYVAKMNALIAKVWTYRMDVLDCSTDDESAELNYKFPLSIINQPEPVADVSMGSSGQKEMVDLAFRIVAAQCLGLDKGPLFLDEFGKTFDESHRDAATNVMRQLMDQLSFSQLFMISHYESCYGAFYNAQITVVDKRNITLPSNKPYNQYTTIAS